MVSYVQKWADEIRNIATPYGYLQFWHFMDNHPKSDTYVWIVKIIENQTIEHPITVFNDIKHS
jgi:hypothetical protein